MSSVAEEQEIPLSVARSGDSPHLGDEEHAALLDESSDDKDPLSASTQYPPSPNESTTTDEKRLLRKLDRRIIPLTAALYLSAYLGQSAVLFALMPSHARADRGNVGIARLQGLQDGPLGGSDANFSLTLSAFFIT
jgi:hypothetical protein